LNPLHLRIICANFGYNWPGGSGEEVENVLQTDEQRAIRKAHNASSSSYHDPWGSGGAKIGKTIFTNIYTEKKILFFRTSTPISIKLGIIHRWVTEQIRPRSSSKGR
jgi:hypothetical protein